MNWQFSSILWQETALVSFFSHERLTFPEADSEAEQKDLFLIL